MKRIIFLMMIVAAGAFASCNYEEINDALEHAIERSWYGNWCGPMHGGGTPVDEIDSLCKAHDECYAANSIAGDQYYECAPGVKVTTCDKPFVIGMRGLDENPALWSPPAPSGMEDEAAQYRLDALKLFGGCVDLFAP